MSVDDKEVGYEKPPKANQFKKGQSGNPKGRPKGSKNVLALVEKLLWKPVQIRQGDQRQSVPIIQAALMALTAKAMQADIKAIESLFKLMERLQLFAPKSPATSTFSGTSSGFTWTDEDETLLPFIEHLENGMRALEERCQPKDSSDPGTRRRPDNGSGKGGEGKQTAPPEKPK